MGHYHFVLISRLCLIFVIWEPCGAAWRIHYGRTFDAHLRLGMAIWTDLRIFTIDVDD